MEKNNWKKHIEFLTIDLHLDTKNPRTDIGNKITEKGVIKELLNEDVLVLVKDILQGGFLAATTLMVIEENEKKIVIDGNRRLLAVKILQKPDIVKEFITKKEFQQINNFSQNLEEDLSSLIGVFYPSRVQAEKEMAKLHLAGIAVKQWKLIRQCRYFQKRLNDEKELSIDVLAELLGIDKSRVKKNVKTFQLYEIAKDKLSDIKNRVGKSIYDDDVFLTDKFQRLVVNEEGERFLGYSFSDKSQKIEIKNEEIFLVQLKHILEGLYHSDLRAQFSAKDRVDFFKTIQSNFLDTKDYKKEIREIREKEKSGQTPMFDLDNEDYVSNQSEETERSRKIPTGLFAASDVPYKLSNTSLRFLYNELRTISVATFSNAAHDLLRSFLECSLVEYLTDKGEYNKLKKNEEHRLKLSELLTHIINNKIINDKDVLDNLEHIKSDWNQPYSLNRMNAVNHNKNYSSIEKDVRQTWGMLEKLFKIILNPKKTIK